MMKAQKEKNAVVIEFPRRKFDDELSSYLKYHYQNSD